MRIQQAINRALAFALFLTLTACYTVDGGPILAGGVEVTGLAGEKSSFMTVSNDGERTQLDVEDHETYEFVRARNGSYSIENPESDEIIFMSAVAIEEDVYVVDAASESGESSPLILMVDRSPPAPHYYFCISADLDDAEISAIAQSVDMEINIGSYGSTTLFPDTADELIGFMAGLWNATEPTDWDCSVMRDPQPTSTKEK